MKVTLNRCYEKEGKKKSTNTKVYQHQINVQENKVVH